MTDAAGPRSRSGGILGIARFYHDPRGSVRAVLASDPREARLLAFAVGAAIFLLFERLVRLFATAGPETDLVARALEQIVSLIFFLPLFYYVVAALATLIARAFGGTGSFKDGRTGFFWAALVSGPIIVLSGLASTILPAGFGSGLLRQVGSFFFIWALAVSLAEAFGFRSVASVFAVIVAIALVPSGLAWMMVG